MAAVTLLFQKTTAMIGAVTLDASVSETHTTEVEVTEHPVEKGSNIGDHKRRKGDVLQIEGLVSNTPIPGPNDPLTEKTAEGGSLPVTFSSRSQLQATRAGTAYQDLLKLADDATLVTIVTAIRTYDDMAITSLVIPRDAKVGQALRFTCTAKQIRIVQSQTVNVAPNVKAKVSLGKKATTPTPPQQTRGSTLSKLGQTAAGQKAKALFLGAIGQ